MGRVREFKPCRHCELFEFYCLPVAIARFEFRKKNQISKKESAVSSRHGRRFEFPNPPHTRPCRLERVHTPTAHLFRKCSNGAFCTSKQHISPRRNDRVRPHTRGGRPHRSGARPTARPQQQQQHQQPQHQQQTATQQQHYKFARSEHHNLGRRGANHVAAEPTVS